MSADRALDYLTDKLTELEALMADQVDPRVFGQLEGAVKGLDSKVGDLEAKVERMTLKVDNLIEIVTEAKGGWRTVVWLGSIAAAIGSGVTWIVAHLNISMK